MSLTLTPLIGIPLIQTGDDLASVLTKVIKASDLTIMAGDVIVITQKVISKAEGNFVTLNSVHPSDQAIELSNVTGKDPRLLEVILSESTEVIRATQGTIITRHRLGFICANAGVDHSNIGGGGDRVLLLPIEPSSSAERLRARLTETFNAEIGVLVIDSHGRAWRNGAVGTAIGGAGFPMLSDQRGWKDLFDSELRVTQVAVADELAAAASLIMGQSNEGKPAVHVRGFPYPLTTQPFSDLLRDPSKDLFL